MKSSGQSQKEKPSKQRQTQPKISDHASILAVAPPLANASTMTDASALDISAIIREVSKNIGEVMEQKLSKFSDTLDKITSRLDDQSKRIGEAEQRVSNVEDQLATMERRLKEMEKCSAGMAQRLDEGENRSRRDNIRILNFKENAEGNNSIQFFESWLPTALGLSTAKGRIKIDRAHRSFGPKGNRPRPVIIKLHNSRDKMKILSAAKKAQNLEYAGSPIYIAQDLSLAVREKRRSFNDVCQKLLDKKIRFVMRYPARLVVNYRGSEHTFENAYEAQTFVDGSLE
ncbi:hypothetical protein PBY51_000796 [Eleginops maclovinus]|uniref:L1 transposable element RRM domain-containing protein n=1 Tax=Eleginops maclovinus TaxID=56733 RepID=A0AAN7XNR0_ELEMC|nr:hypothetical protein PBY51_000796 [Eleginops maclovinus]